MTYETTLGVLRAAEQALVGKPAVWPKHPGARAYADTVLGGPWLVMAGAGILFWRLVWVSVAFATFTGILSMFADGSLVDVLPPAALLGFGVVYFSMPSRSLASVVKEANVLSLRTFILSVAPNSQSLSRLQEGVAIVRAHTMDKVGRFNVLAGVAWGVLFWYASTHAFAPGLASDVAGRGLSYGLVATLLFVLALLAGTCHATAVRAMHQTLEFALLEARVAAEPSATGAPFGS